MRALVTGASGFVASALCRALLARGHTVVALSRDPSRARARIGSALARGQRALAGIAANTQVATHLEDHDQAECEAEVIEGSIASPSDVARAARGCAMIFHAAGISALTAPPRVLRWVHVAGTENVLRAARHAHVGRVVCVSCADVSLTDDDRMHWDEQRSLPDLPVGPHARSKLMAEELALAASDETLEVTALRPARLWGPDDVDGIAAFAGAVMGGSFALYGGGRNLVATTHIDNLVAASLQAATASAAPGRSYYVTDGEFLEAREFYGRLAQAVLPSASLRSASLPIALVKARLRDLLRGSRGAERAAVLRDGRSALFDVSRATLDLGYRASVDLDARFDELAGWVATQGGASSLLTRARPAPVEADVDAQVRAAGGD